MKKTVLFVAAIVFTLFSNSHYSASAMVVLTSYEDAADSIYQEADEMPSPIGGMTTIAKKVVYPEYAQKTGREGTVYVSMLIDEKGNVIKSGIKKSVDSLLDAAALAAVKNVMFSPAKKEGKAVKIELVIPIRFALDAKRTAPVNEAQPFPVGGMEAIMRNIIYPEKAKADGTQGKVIVKAHIGKDGEVMNAEILKRLSHECDAEAINAVKSVKFTPAKKNGKTIEAEIVIPIVFRLE